jgi:transcriptional regulator GlxA family with amidase domain
LRELRERPTDLFAKRVTEYVAENISKEISVSSLAELFGYTEAHFCRKFKAAMGISPMIYLKIHRLDTACKYIRSSDASISDIALICGFTDANYFSRCFKERYELSPMKYRKKNSEY